MESASEILSKENTLRKLTDFVLLNSCSINSSGLYNGKAGMALALFEISRCLQDEYIEEQASELLQESLLSKNKDIGFENGLSGIGFVLLYLIENKFVNADFKELFGNHLSVISDTLKEWKDKQPSSAHLFDNVQIVSFLDEIPLKDKSAAVVSSIEWFSTAAESVLVEQFKKESDTNLLSKNPKIEVLEAFEKYLKIAYHCQTFRFSRSISDISSSLYQKNRYVGNLFIGCYLHAIAIKTGDEVLEAVAGTNTKYAIKDIHLETLSLTQRLNLFYLLSSLYPDVYPESIRLLEEGLFDIRENSTQEKDLLLSIQPASSMAGYQSGVSRLLLYWAYRWNRENRMSCTRFKKIF